MITPLVVEGNLTWAWTHGDACWVTIDGKDMISIIEQSRPVPVMGHPWGRVRMTIEWLDEEGAE
jgi:hypothetical protein